MGWASLRVYVWGRGGSVLFTIWPYWWWFIFSRGVKPLATLVILTSQHHDKTWFVGVDPKNGVLLLLLFYLCRSNKYDKLPGIICKVFEPYIVDCFMDSFCTSSIPTFGECSVALRFTVEHIRTSFSTCCEISKLPLPSGYVKIAIENGDL